MIDLTKEIIHFDEFNRAKRRVIGIEKIKRKRKKLKKDLSKLSIGDVVCIDYFTQIEQIKKDACLRTYVSHMNLKSRSGLMPKNVKIEAIERDKNFKIAINNNERHRSHDSLSTRRVVDKIKSKDHADTVTLNSLESLQHDAIERSGDGGNNKVSLMIKLFENYEANKIVKKEDGGNGSSVNLKINVKKDDQDEYYYRNLDGDYDNASMERRVQRMRGDLASDETLSGAKNGKINIKITPKYDRSQNQSDSRLVIRTPSETIVGESGVRRYLIRSVSKKEVESLRSQSKLTSKSLIRSENSSRLYLIEPRPDVTRREKQRAASAVPSTQKRSENVYQPPVYSSSRRPVSSMSAHRDSKSFTRELESNRNRTPDSVASASESRGVPAHVVQKPEPENEVEQELSVTYTSPHNTYHRTVKKIFKEDDRNPNLIETRSLHKPLEGSSRLNHPLLEKRSSHEISKADYDYDKPFESIKNTKQQTVSQSDSSPKPAGSRPQLLRNFIRPPNITRSMESGSSNDDPAATRGLAAPSAVDSANNKHPNSIYSPSTTTTSTRLPRREISPAFARIISIFQQNLENGDQTVKTRLEQQPIERRASSSSLGPPLVEQTSHNSRETMPSSKPSREIQEKRQQIPVYTALSKLKPTQLKTDVKNDSISSDRDKSSPPTFSIAKLSSVKLITPKLEDNKPDDKLKKTEVDKEEEANLADTEEKQQAPVRQQSIRRFRSLFDSNRADRDENNSRSKSSMVEVSDSPSPSESKKVDAIRSKLEHRSSQSEESESVSAREIPSQIQLKSVRPPSHVKPVEINRTDVEKPAAVSQRKDEIKNDKEIKSDTTPKQPLVRTRHEFLQPPKLNFARLSPFIGQESSNDSNQHIKADEPDSKSQTELIDRKEDIDSSSRDKQNEEERVELKIEEPAIVDQVKPDSIPKEPSSLDPVVESSELKQLDFEHEKVNEPESSLDEEKQKAKLAEEIRLAEEAKKVDEIKRLAAEKDRQAEEAKRLEEDRLIAEKTRLDQEAEKARLAEEARLADESKKVEEERIEAEKARLAKVEQLRLAEEERLIAEKARLDQEAKAEEARLAEEASKKVEEERLMAEKARIAEKLKLAEETRLKAEDKRLDSEAKAEEARLLEQPQEPIREVEQARPSEETRPTEISFPTIVEEKVPEDFSEPENNVKDFDEEKLVEKTTPIEETVTPEELPKASDTSELNNVDNDADNRLLKETVDENLSPKPLEENLEAPDENADELSTSSGSDDFPQSESEKSLLPFDQHVSENQGDLWSAFSEKTLSETVKNDEQDQEICSLNELNGESPPKLIKNDSEVKEPQTEPTLTLTEPILPDDQLTETLESSNTLESQKNEETDRSISVKDDSPSLKSLPADDVAKENGLSRETDLVDTMAGPDSESVQSSLSNSRSENRPESMNSAEKEEAMDYVPPLLSDRMAYNDDEVESREGSSSSSSDSDIRIDGIESSDSDEAVAAVIQPIEIDENKPVPAASLENLIAEISEYMKNFNETPAPPATNETSDNSSEDNTNNEPIEALQPVIEEDTDEQKQEKDLTKTDDQVEPSKASENSQTTEEEKIVSENPKEPEIMVDPNQKEVVVEESNVENKNEISVSAVPEIVPDNTKEIVKQIVSSMFNKPPSVSSSPDQVVLSSPMPALDLMTAASFAIPSTASAPAEVIVYPPHMSDSMSVTASTALSAYAPPADETKEIVKKLVNNMFNRPTMNDPAMSFYFPNYAGASNYFVPGPSQFMMRPPLQQQQYASNPAIYPLAGPFPYVPHHSSASLPPTGAKGKNKKKKTVTFSASSSPHPLQQQPRPSGKKKKNNQNISNLPINQPRLHAPTPLLVPNPQPTGMASFAPLPYPLIQQNAQPPLLPIPNFFSTSSIPFSSSMSNPVLDFGAPSLDDSFNPQLMNSLNNTKYPNSFPVKPSPGSNNKSKKSKKLPQQTQLTNKPEIEVANTSLLGQPSSPIKQINNKTKKTKEPVNVTSSVAIQPAVVATPPPAVSQPPAQVPNSNIYFSFDDQPMASSQVFDEDFTANTITSPPPIPFMSQLPPTGPLLNETSAPKKNNKAKKSNKQGVKKQTSQEAELKRQEEDNRDILIDHSLKEFPLFESQQTLAEPQDENQASVPSQPIISWSEILKNKSERKMSNPDLVIGSSAKSSQRAPRAKSAGMSKKRSSVPSNTDSSLNKAKSNSSRLPTENWHEIDDDDSQARGQDNKLEKKNLQSSSVSQSTHSINELKESNQSLNNTGSTKKLFSDMFKKD